MSATDLERLTAQFDADVSKFEKQMTKMGVAYDRQAKAIEQKNGALTTKLNKGWESFGKRLEGGLKGGGVAALLGGGAVVGIGAGIADLIDKSLDAGKALEETSRAAGVSVEKLQTLRFASSQTGGSFAIMDEALTTFNKTFGEFLNTGAGKGANAFKNLGIDKLINSGAIRTTEQAFDTFMEKIRAIPNEAQRISYASNVMGRDIGPKMAGFIDAGAQAVTDLENKARSLGIVMSDETARSATEAKVKLDALFDVMKAKGVNAIASLAPEIADLADQITNNLPDLALWVERWAAWFGLIKLSPLDQLKADIADAQAMMDDADKGKASWWRNPLGINNGWYNAQKAMGQAKLNDLNPKFADALEDQMAEQYAAEIDGPAKPALPPKLHTGSTAGERDAAAKAAEELAQKRKEMMDKLGVDQATADAALVADQNKLTVQLLTGQTGYYDAVQKMIADDMNAKLAVIDAEEKKQIDSLGKQGTAWKGYAAAVAQAHAIADAKRGSLQADMNSEADEKLGGAFDRDAATQANRQIQSYKDQIANLGLVEGALAAAVYRQEEYNKQIDAGIPAEQINIALINEKAAAVGVAAQAESDAAKISERSIQVQDEVRTGLEDVGVAGLRGFKDMKDAASQFIEQLAEMILKLYVMKPLIESLLGPQGGSGGGLLGDFLGSIFGSSSSPAGGVMGFFPFAKGGVMTPNGPRQLPRYAAGGVSNSAAIFGEGGPEAAVPLPDGRRIPVALRLPSPRQMGRGAPIINAPVYVTQNLAGAISPEGVATISRDMAVAVGSQFSKQIHAEFPSLMAKAMRDNL